MATYLTNDTDLEAVADAIRTKGGTSADLVFPQGFVDAIDAIETGGGDVVVGTTVVTTGNKVVIPKVPGKQNFVAYVDATSEYFTGGSNRIFWMLRIEQIKPGYGLNTRSTNTNFPPTSTNSYWDQAYFRTETDTAITYTFSNQNTMGFVPNGTTFVYMWF